MSEWNLFGPPNTLNNVMFLLGGKGNGIEFLSSSSDNMSRLEPLVEEDEMVLISGVAQSSVDELLLN